MRVLLVEDEPRLAETIKRGLIDQGFVVDIASNGPDGLWWATEHDFDAIVLDIMLPGMSGYKVLEELRERRVWTPVLMLTAKDGEYDQVDAFDLGADDYLTNLGICLSAVTFQNHGSPRNPFAVRTKSARTRRIWLNSTALFLHELG